LCLVTAIISVVMIGPAMDEVLASLQHLRRCHNEGRSFWRTFWGLDERALPTASPFGRRAYG
jgi:hypothetical protein